MVNAGNAGRSLDMMCDEFLASHSEYVDGLLPPLRAARVRAHAAACASCARYDRIVRKGAELVRDLPAAQPSDDFERRLQHRIFHMQDRDVLARPRGSSAAGALGIAAAIALLAWSPLLVTRAGSSDATAAALYEPVLPDAAFDSRPLFGTRGWYPLALPAPSTQQPTTLLAMFPGPYSPLVVTPPVHRSVRAVSAERTPID